MEIKIIYASSKMITREERTDEKWNYVQKKRKIIKKNIYNNLICVEVYTAKI